MQICRITVQIRVLTVQIYGITVQICVITVYEIIVQICVITIYEITAQNLFNHSVNLFNHGANLFNISQLERAMISIEQHINHYLEGRDPFARSQEAATCFALGKR